MVEKVLFICGSINQTTIMHQIAENMPQYEHYYTPYYTDTFLKYLVDMGFVDFSILGGQFRKHTEQYLYDNDLFVDYKGMLFDYDLVVTGSDLIIPKNIRNNKIVLIQEGMTDPENFAYYLVKWLKLPRYFASTSTTGLSDAYQKFCVASEGYRELFTKKGVKAEKIEVTGIPNFDNAETFLDNDFPHKNYVLVATSDTRETFKYDNRKKFIKHAIDIAAGKQLIFKLHPNENFSRAEKEIKEQDPNAIVVQSGNTNHMIANCDILITQYSSVAFIGLALGKEVHSYFDINELKKIMPIQNGGTSAKNIAQVCSELIEDSNSFKTELDERVKIAV